MKIKPLSFLVVGTLCSFALSAEVSAHEGHSDQGDPDTVEVGGHTHVVAAANSETANNTTTVSASDINDKEVESKKEEVVTTPINNNEVTVTEIELNDQDKKVTNKWVTDNKDGSWTYTDESGNVTKKVVKEEKNRYYHVNGEKQFDKLVDVNGKNYYFEPETSGKMAINKWSISYETGNWYHADKDGVVTEELRVEDGKRYYFVNGEKKTDTLVNIYSKQMYVNQYVMTNGWAFSPSTSNYYSANKNGFVDKSIIKEGDRYAYYVNGKRVTNKAVLITRGDKKEVFKFGADGLTTPIKVEQPIVVQPKKEDSKLPEGAIASPREKDLALTKNNWTISDKTGNAYYVDANGKITKEIVVENGRKVYYENGVAPKSLLIPVYNNQKIYVDSYGKVATSRWTILPNTFDWIYSDAKGMVTRELINVNGKKHYYEDGKRNVDKLLNIYKNQLFISPDTGAVSTNRWAHSEKTGNYYESDKVGFVTRKIEKIGNYYYLFDGKKIAGNTAITIGDKTFSFNKFGMSGAPTKSGVEEGLALNKNAWTVSAKTGNQYFTDKDGKVTKRLVRKDGHVVYFEKDEQKKDVLVNVANNALVYIDDKGHQLFDHWKQSPTKRSYYYADKKGIVTKELRQDNGKLAYYEQGKRVTDAVVDYNGRQIFVESGANGHLAYNKWSRSEKTGNYYHTNKSGYVDTEIRHQSGKYSLYVNGQLAKNQSVTIDGKTLKFNEHGLLDNKVMLAHEVKLKGQNATIRMRTASGQFANVPLKEYFGQRYAVEALPKSGEVALYRGDNLVGYADRKLLVEVPFGKRTVYLDAGHGGAETGAITGNVTEKALNLNITLEVAKRLRALGYIVYETRTTDKEVKLMDRSTEPNELMPDIYVSVHHNAFRGKDQGILSLYHDESISEPGYETLPYHPKSKITEGKRLATVIHNTLLKTTGAPNNGLRPQNLAVVRRTDAPAALIELGFMDNPTEFKKLTNPAYQEKLIRGLVDGIVNFFK